MSEPLVQVVDENDQPIGSAEKPEIWKKGLRHRIVWIVVENPGGYLLIQKRPKTMDLYPDCWDVSVGGHVDASEGWEEAARRELKEELGVTKATLEEIGKFYNESEFKGRKLNRFLKTYRFVTMQKEFEYDKQEVAEVKWMDINEVKELIQSQPDNVANGLKEVIRRYY